MDRQFSMPIARAAGKPVGQVRQLLRALREAGLVLGFGYRPTSTHIARVVLALGANLVKDVAPTVNQLRVLPLQTTCSLPATAEPMLARLIETIPKSPVLDDYDLDGGLLHITADSVILECLSLTGKRVCVRYGATQADHVTSRTTVPIDTIRRLTEALQELK